MSRNISILELVRELELQQVRKRDMVAPSTHLSFRDGKLIIRESDNESGLNRLLPTLGITATEEMPELVLDTLPRFEEQVREKLDIPKAYYDRCKEKAMPLLDTNLNYWLERANKNYLVRSFVDDNGGGVARALLSDSYKCIDNYDILFAAIDAVKQSGMDVRVDAADLTDNRMYVRFYSPSAKMNLENIIKKYTPRHESTRRPGDIQLEPGDETKGFGGFILSNSEVGSGSYSLTPRITLLSCWNGQIVTQDAQRRIHIGSKQTEGVINWSEEVKRKQIELAVAELRDAVKHFLSPAYLNQLLAGWEEQAEKLLNRPMDTVINVAAEYGYSDDKRNELLQTFLGSGNVTAFGLVHAITEIAQLEPTGDGQFTMECDAMSILNNISKYDRPAKKKVMR